jgi:hypothetical protein
MTNKYMKQCSASLAIKERQIKTTLRFHLTPVRSAIIMKTTNDDKDTGKKETLYTVGGNVNWYTTMEISMEVPQKTKYRPTL